MARLRIRIELNRGGVGVPLHKLASVVAEAQKFFHMLGGDIHIDQNQGEWLGFDFDHESLNFTAEFVGAVTAEQVSAFNAAFDGTTSLRRATIAQFARITDAIEEDELIGFGLYLNETGTEPGEWRCLSRRDALRIAEEIRLLIGDSEEAAPESHLPAVSDSSIGARLFSERRERAVEPARWMGAVREVEANLSRRIGKLETEVLEHTVRIDDLGAKSISSEASIGRLVSAVEGFCEQATRRLETLPPQALPAAAMEAAPAEPSVVSSPVATLSNPEPDKAFSWRSTPVILVATSVAVIGLLSLLFWPSRPDSGQKTVSAAPVEHALVKPAVAVASPPPTEVVASVPAPTPTPVPVPTPTAIPAPAPPAPQPGVAHLDLEATEPTWISVTDAGGKSLMAGLLQPHDVRSVDLAGSGVLLVGNADGVTVQLNGKPIGPIGPHGAIRDVEFKDGTFRIFTPAK